MTKEEAAALGDLRRIWEGAYHVGLIDGVWRAKRFNDVTAVITADPAGELKAMIESDYASWTSPARS
jgi:hypothetical protein